MCSDVYLALPNVLHSERPAYKETGFGEETAQVSAHLFLYVDRDFGLMHVRLQTWLPFSIQVCVNGREWLARQMDRAGIRYTKRDNCFTYIEDIGAAQRLM